MKLKLIALAGLMATTVSSFAAMSGAASGNGELLLNMRYYTGPSNSGGNDISAVFDLGITMNDFLANRNTAGYNPTWDLNSANYGTAFADVLAFVDGLGGNRDHIEYNVIALDSTDANLDGGSRYLTTAVVTVFPSLVNSRLRAFDGMDVYVQANNMRGTHATFENGASTATQSQGSDVNPTYFGSIVGTAGDTWRVQTTVDTTARIGVKQNFWYLTTNGEGNNTQVFKRAFGVDVNGNGAISAITGDRALEADEYGKFYFGSFDTPGTLDGSFGFMNPVPEPETYAMLIAGLGLVGAIARRRRASKA